MCELTKRDNHHQLILPLTVVKEYFRITRVILTYMHHGAAQPPRSVVGVKVIVI